MSNDIKITTAQLLKVPLIVMPNKGAEVKSKIAGALLFLFFGLLGCAIINGGFKAAENRLVYLVFGFFLLATPFFIYMLVRKAKNKAIVQIDKDGISIKKGSVYKWENLKSLTYHLAMKKHSGGTAPNQCYLLDFHFTDGSARAGFLMNGFADVLYVAGNLNVPKKEKINAYRQ